MGSLTPGFRLPLGSSVGQIPEPGPRSTNLLPNTFAPNATFWTANVGAAFNLVVGDQWNAGFIPIVASGSVAADTITTNAVVSVAPAHYCASFQVTADIAALGIATPSTDFSISLTWSGGRVDTFRMNPVTGNGISASNTITNVDIEPFIANAGGSDLQAFAVSFEVDAPAGSVSPLVVTITPSNRVAGGQIEIGGIQIEQAVSPSEFMPTMPLLNSTSLRATGMMPREIIDRDFPAVPLTADYSYVPGQDDGKAFFLSNGSHVFTLPVFTNTNGILRDGETCRIVTYYNAVAGQWTIQRAAAGITLQGPGFPAGVNSFLMPATDATHSFVSITMQWNLGLGAWTLVESNVGTFNSGGIIITGEPTVETPVGVVDGANRVFTLSGAASFVQFFINGILQRQGIDFALAPGNTITCTNLPQNIPQAGDAIFAFWWS